MVWDMFNTEIRFVALLGSLAVVGLDAGESQASQPPAFLTMPLDGSAAPTGYKVVNLNFYGKALLAEKVKATSVPTALRASLTDLTKFFGTKPTLGKVYEDSRDHRMGAADFAVTWQGQAFRGLLLTRLRPGGAKVLAIYSRSDTPRARWAELLGASEALGASPGSTDRSAAAAPAPSTRPPRPYGEPLKPYRFPDGTGFVGLARGWTTQAQSCQNGFLLTGPAGQRLSMGFSQRVNLPNSVGASMPNSPFPTAPFMAPQQAVVQMTPIMSQLSVRRGGPSFVIDNIVERRDIQPVVPMGPNATTLSYGVTETPKGGSPRHYRVLASVSTLPAEGQWVLSVHEMEAPDPSFDQDLPAMLAMAQSWRVNVDVVNKKTQVTIAQREQWFNEQQKAMQARYEASYEANRRFMESQRSEPTKGSAARKSAADAAVDDFDEYLRGSRTVVDTRTGEKGSADLGSVDEIVDGLNIAEPGRYRQIPLRDE